MSQLLSSLFRIVLLRSNPGILPASGLLVTLMAIVYAATSALQSWIIHGGDRIVARTAVDLGLAFALFWVLLTATRSRHRYLQTISAVLGISVVIAPIVIMLLLLMRGPATTNYPVWLLTNTGSIAVTAWFLLAVGHIVKCALETGYVTGVAVALTWLIASKVITQKLFPVGA
ncbi:MAG: hypothetical protein ACREVI_10190 [Steroidobacteraceae bacterium]